MTMQQTLAAEQAAAPAPPIVTPAAVRRQRRPVLAVLAGLLILLGAGGGALVFLSLGSTVEAVAARVPVARGQLMTAEMFTTVQIAPDQQLAYLEANQLPTLIGQRAAHDVAAGTLVSATVAVEQMVPSAGRTVVGMSLPPGAEPAIELLVGDRVRVILTEPAYACAAGESSAETGTSTVACDVNVVIPGVVVATARDEASGQVSVSVEVDQADAARTAAAAALGRAALVLDSRDN